jgi:cellulose synthase/poly-beta-1,6-N-acetylglucosamine synthase-like glycosyltransferase
MKAVFFHFLEYANVVFLAYFLAANAVYTVLMCLSLYAVSLHSKFAAEKPYGDMADSPITPPITLIVPAYNEEDAIVDTVLSLRDLNYPGKEILVVDDGSDDGTVRQLIERFQLRRVDVIYREAIKTSPVKAF